MIDSYQTRNDFRILHYLGKDQGALKQFALIDLIIRFLLPIAPFLFISGLLLIGISVSNFSDTFVQTLWSSASIYVVILLILGILFSGIAYKLNSRTIKEVIQS